MHAWVTGATGFVGARLVERLLARGDDVTALVRPESLGRALGWGRRVRIVAGELPLRRRLFDDAPDPEVVFHCAADLSQDPRRARDVNEQGTAQVADLALARGARLVHLSTVSVFGYRHRDAEVDETTPCEPFGTYGETKRAAEAEVEARAARGLDHAILRPPIVYGPGSRSDLVQLVARAIARGRFARIGDGLGRMSLCFIEHLVDALLFVSTRTLHAERVFVVDDGAPVTHRAVAEAIARALGRPTRFWRVPVRPTFAAARAISAVYRAVGRRAPFTPWEVTLLTMSFPLKTDRIRALGFRPTHDFESAIARTVEGLGALGKL